MSAKTFPPDGPVARLRQRAFSNPILRERIGHYSGNSYLRVMHGNAEIILIGEYVADDRGRENPRTNLSSEISQVIGEEYPVDQYDIAEGEAYLGTYLSEFVSGNFFDGTRRVIAERAKRSIESGLNFSRFVRATSTEDIIFDLYYNGVNESPASAFRNAPTPPGYQNKPGAGKAGGVPVNGILFFRGQPALLRKPSIATSARLNPRHHGYYSDLVFGVENTRLYKVSEPGAASTLLSPVNVSFVIDGEIISPENSTDTELSNLSSTGEVSKPFFDGVNTERPDLNV